jgi:hypothetical protein
LSSTLKIPMGTYCGSAPSRSRNHHRSSDQSGRPTRPLQPPATAAKRIPSALLFCARLPRLSGRTVGRHGRFPGRQSSAKA